jgi:hypothetical protein
MKVKTSIKAGTATTPAPCPNLKGTNPSHT